MKRNTNYKKLISLAFVLILLVSITIPNSYALSGNGSRRFGALVLSALQAINIYATATLAPAQSLLDTIADPPNVSQPYTYPWEPTWDDDYLNRSSIQIWPDYTEIDGVKYTDVWLSHDAAEKFRVNAFDWKTAYNIASESEGTFASGVGHVDGTPIFLIGNVKRSQWYTDISNGTYNVGNTIVTVNPTAQDPYTRVNTVYSNGATYSNRMNGTLPYYAAKTMDNIGNGSMFIQNQDGTGVTGNMPCPSALVDSTAFDFDYVTGSIPADEVLPQDTGMMIRVPSDSPGLQTFITNNIDFTNEGGVNLDFNLHPELQIAVDDLLDIIAPIVPVVNTGDIQFTVNHEQPAPVINNLLPDTYKQEILQPITENFYQTQQKIENMGDTIVENIPKIEEICNNIDTAPYHDLNTGLDHLPSIFLPFITDLRSALGIWHYVTEWIGQISATFAFVTGCLVGTSIMTPIYAAIAGFMCIKIYRRMTA